MADDEPDQWPDAQRRTSLVAARRSGGDLRLFDSGYFADIEVSYKDKTWRLHRIILCCRSRWFQKMFEGPWVEAQSSKVTITAEEDWDPVRVEQCLRLIYSGGLNRADLRNEKSPFRACIDIWYLAEYFQVDDLMEDSKSIMARYCDQLKDDLLTFLTFEDNEPTPSITATAKFEFEPCDLQSRRQEISEGLFAVYRYPINNPLRKIFCAFVVDCGFRLFPNDSLSELCAALPDFGRDLLPGFIEGTHCREDPESVLQKARHLCLSEGQRCRCVQCRKYFVQRLGFVHDGGVINTAGVRGFMLCHNCRRAQGIDEMIMGF